MELWIRSQDKKELLNVNNLAVVENRIVFINNGNGRATLGTYKSIERALEVLDEIQDKLKVLVTNEAGAEFILARNLVPIIYEMPQR